MPSLEQQLAAAQEMVASMDAQLVSLYEDLEHAPAREAALAAMVESLNAQVCALLDERAELERALAEARRGPRPAAAARVAAAVA